MLHELFIFKYITQNNISTKGTAEAVDLSINVSISSGTAWVCAFVTDLFCI